MFERKALVPPQPTCSLATDDPQDILRFALDAPGTVALVTLVEIVGGAARSLGAQMAVRDDGRYCGYVAGGCVEGAVAAEALASIQRGTDRFLRLGEGSPFFDIVLPCGGGLKLSIHLLRRREVLSAALVMLAQRQQVALAYDPATQTLQISEHHKTGWAGERFVRAYRPRQRLSIAGTGIEAEATRRLAGASGYDVVDLASVEPDAFTAVAVLLHDLDRELPLLDKALASPAPYIGALGSRRTHQKRCTVLRQRGHSAEDIARIRGPIGLFGPARDASTLALSILADIAQ